MYRKKDYKKKGYKKRAPTEEKRMQLREQQRGYMRTEGLYGRFSGTAAAGGELKFVDQAIDAPQIPKEGSIVATLLHIPQNTTPSGRIGRKVCIKYLGIKGEFELFNDATPIPSGTARVRMIVYLDKQANGTGASVAEILAKNPSANSALENVRIDSFRELTNINRFVVLSDKTHTLSVGSTFWHTADGLGSSTIADQRNVRTVKTVKVNIGSKNIPIEYSGVNGTSSEIRSNNIGLLLITSDLGDDTVKFTGTVRARYSDN